MESETPLHIKELTSEMIFPTTGDMYEKDAWGSKMVVLGKPNCFEKNTQILMFNGSVKHVQDIQVGDVIMGDDSTPRNVVSLSRGRDIMFKVVPKIGDPVVVNSSHIITVIKVKGNNRGQIIDMPINIFTNLSAKIKASYNWIRVPVEFPKCHQKISPYILAFFVDGDYNFIKREFIKSHFEVSDVHIDKLIEKNVPRIPNHIMYSSIEDRAEYLAGMLDSKATYNSITKRFDMPLITEELCNQVMFLAGSLGYYTSKIKNYKSNFFTQTHQLFWSCYIYVNSNTVLPSKIFDIVYIKTVFGGIFTTDFYVTEESEGDFYGFAIDGNQRFLLGDFSVTHNSGKCLGANTPVIMHDGDVKLVQDVKVGDLLMGDDSEPRRVLQLYAGKDQLYKVKQDKGDDYVVNSNHIMTVFDSNHVIDIPVKSVDPAVHYGLKTKIKFPRAETATNPYSYGYMLADTDVVDMSYIVNDETTRLDVLAGFLDARNVTYCVKSHAYMFELRSAIRRAIMFLVQTLGFCMLSIDAATDKYMLCGPIGKITCSARTSISKNRVSRDLQAADPYVQTRLEIVQHGFGAYYGFELDRNQRFVLGDCTVTHNTYAIKSLLYQKRHIFPVGMVFSGSENASGQWGELFPPSFVYNRLRLDKIQDFLQRQILARKHLINPWGVLLVDDCGYDSKTLKSEVFKEIFQNGRHYKMMFLLALQHPADIMPAMRTCIDFTMIFADNLYTNRKKIWENYASVIPTFSLFCSILDQVTSEKYTALVINNLVTSPNWVDSLFWFKAAPFPPDFKFGSNDYWRHHYVRYEGR